MPASEIRKVVEDTTIMSQPVFSTTLEEDLVQRVGTKLHLEVTVEDQSEKVQHCL